MTRNYILKFIIGIAFISVYLLNAIQAQIVHVTILQTNDVYEIMAVSNGTQGGLARLATIKEQLLAKNPNTYTILSGDLFSPSALGTANIDGKPLAGKQMVDLMNLAGLDYATFGNHEFDLKEEQFYQRLAESKFKWFSGNVFDKNLQPFPNVSEYEILEITAKNKVVKIGIIGVTLDSNLTDYVKYIDPFITVKKQVELLKNKVDILVAVTHLALEDDIKLAKIVPELDIILGGHEHENIQIWRGKDFTPIFKADANARSVYVHDLYYNTDTSELDIKSHLKLVNEQIPKNTAVLKQAEYWENLAFASFEKDGFNPKEIVVTTTDELDGTEVSVRNKPTKLTELIANGMLNVATNTELTIFNSGSIRIDDVIPVGEIIEYDIIRVLPFGGEILSVSMTGSLLKQVLDQGVKNKGTGGYLQTAKTIQKDGSWLINGKVLDENQNYIVAINDFLVSGREQNLEYLDIENNQDIQPISEHGDIRKAFIQKLKKTYP
ncbi:MAG: bifunctional metallophosphatase/5'-nucleotidase [Candidatus Marithrix sp.]